MYVCEAENLAVLMKVTLYNVRQWAYNGDGIRINLSGVPVN